MGSEDYDLSDIYRILDNLYDLVLDIRNEARERGKACRCEDFPELTDEQLIRAVRVAKGEV